MLVAAAVLLAAATLASGTASPGSAANSMREAPKPVPAWSVTARDPQHLRAQVVNYARAFARRQDDRRRLMLLNFGGVRTPDGSTFGTAYRPVAGGNLVYFSNPTVLRALKAAADAYHRRRQHGAAVIAYGTTNYKLASPSGDFRDMSLADAAAAGRDLAQVATDLRCYQRGATAGGCPSPPSGRHYRHQRAALAGDIEMNWEQAPISRRLVNGAAGPRGFRGRYYDYGTAGGCATQCRNGWTLGDLTQVSFDGAAVPLPEIYYRSPDQAADWRQVQRHYNRAHAGGCPYRFAGVTGTPGKPLNPRQGWRRLKRRTCGELGRELITIHLRSGGGKRSPEQTPLGSPIGEPTAPGVVSEPTPLFSSDQLWPLVNAWGAETRRRLTAVQAGADPDNPSAGVLGIFRQSFVHVRQTQTLVRVPGAGPLEITGAPTGGGAKRSAQRRGMIAFEGRDGVTGTLDLANDSLSVQSAR